MTTHLFAATVDVSVTDVSATLRHFIGQQVKTHRQIRYHRAILLCLSLTPLEPQSRFGDKLLEI